MKLETLQDLYVDELKDLYSAEHQLLKALPTTVRERLFPHLELVELPLGNVLYESGDVLGHVYFPTDCIISLLHEIKNGGTAQISVVGNDGILGIFGAGVGAVELVDRRGQILLAASNRKAVVG